MSLIIPRNSLIFHHLYGVELLADDGSRDIGSWLGPLALEPRNERRRPPSHGRAFFLEALL